MSVNMLQRAQILVHLVSNITKKQKSDLQFYPRHIGCSIQKPLYQVRPFWKAVCDQKDFKNNGNQKDSVNREELTKDDGNNTFTSTCDPDSKATSASTSNSGKTKKPVSPKNKLEELVDFATNPSKKPRIRVDLSASSMERNFITPIRAMSDFLLKPEELQGLRATKRRSPYENEPPIPVFWRKDVEAKAMKKWGSKENLLKEILKRELETKYYHQMVETHNFLDAMSKVSEFSKYKGPNPVQGRKRGQINPSPCMFTLKKKLRNFRRTSPQEELMQRNSGLLSSSGKVVMTAIAMNGSNFLFKLFAWVYTGSHSMFAECIHSFADTANQIILAFGINKSVQKPDSDHPYGYTNMKYVASLISGVAIFCVGSGLSVYHGVSGLISPSQMESFYWAFFILGGSFVTESATLLVAYNSMKKGAIAANLTFKQYMFRGTDPSVTVVFLEDLAAVVSVFVTATCMGLTSFYHTPIPDAVGSLLVGSLLGAVASFIIYTNVAALVGRSIPQDYLDKINAELESDVMIRAIHDVKGIDIGNSLIRYKAELDFDGRELARSYLDKQDLNCLLDEVKKMETIEELESFILNHSENIIDMLGGEIDRIELKLRKKFPEIRHCDLEIL